jgi:hypothetical protein
VQSFGSDETRGCDVIRVVTSPTDSVAAASYLGTNLSSARSSASSACTSGGEVVVEGDGELVVRLGSGKRHSHQSVASTDSCQSESSVARRARRLAKKVIVVDIWFSSLL